MKLGISGKKISSTVLISMTDVIFLLLIFLLIASNFAAQTGLPFKLPGSTSQQRQTPQVLHVQYQNDNRIDFMDGSYTIQTLGEALKNQFKSSDQVVRLSAQKDTPLQNIVSLMDIIREAGFERIFVATEPVNK
ncbi:MAG: biopolymer transporter ExbD [Candidatus Cloacimonadaceae bacterium]|jgi:biopolymer transport protein ExbD|nr:biopolymer transporter ExbD [Candidatus Cloacimonadota bacterium]MDX9949655.1 biopolymer transporter ExbD [Candidatus Syntrophosphaera sp.]NLN85817.1 biopolymer transporter ExbD [Candidatus Cloacimonadota bacterium]